jgi:hypothetical protein
MREIIERVIIVVICSFIFTVSAYADNSGINLSLPSSPGTYGQDSIRAGDLDCKNAIGGSTTFEVGLTGIIDNYQSPFGSGNDNAPTEKKVGVFARIVVPLDGPKERINCNSLYELELRKKRIEVLKLQEELEALKRLNSTGNGGFEN